MRVGLIGTGYAAKLRAEALKAEPRAELVAIAGRTPARTQEFSHTYGAIACASWQDLLMLPDLDLVVISTVNQDHGAIAHAALTAQKHVIVEYPLSLDVAEAQALLDLATTQNKLLHVEHIELLGGVHQALRTTLPRIGSVFYARYATLKPEHPAPQRWSYHTQTFGFPLMGALSRLHRLVDLFGEVDTVACSAHFEKTSDFYYSTCLCTAHLQFRNGVMAEVTYGKGEALWQAERKFEVQGEQGALVFAGEQGTLINADGVEALEVGGRRGLFAKDTTMVLDFLTLGNPLYVTPEASLYTLKVADAARRAAEEGQRLRIGD
ncbi:MAG: Gfo/Idh/MocA family oxidoreductase [Oscillatoriales cyanobacterium C42_A2020_001]|nr:Gfo/Idh/MocA family oxidoreductase [Leptolyngbyaceae cyanobacterium C42_A2020_001]